MYGSEGVCEAGVLGNIDKKQCTKDQSQNQKNNINIKQRTLNADKDCNDSLSCGVSK